jgi:hypothetical protein
MTNAIDTTTAPTAPVRKKRTVKVINALRREQGLKPYADKKAPTLSRSDKQRHQEFLVALMDAKGERIINRIINKALDDDDKDQMVCMKMCIDRILPQSFFENNNKKASGGVTIQIMGVGGGDGVVINGSSDVEDVEEAIEE